MKINDENLLDAFRILYLSLGTINTRSNLFVNCIWIAEIAISSEIRVIAVCLTPTGPLPVFHHKPSYVQTAKSKLSLIKNPRDRHVHNSLSNHALHNIHCAGRD